MSRSLTIWPLTWKNIFLLSVTLWTITSCNDSNKNTEADGNCKKGWEKYDGKCYKIFSNDRDDVFDKTFEEAKNFCEEQSPGSGSLVVVHKHHQIDFLVSYLGRPGIQATVYIGLHKSSHYRAFKWVDGTSMDFENFVPGEPSNGYDEKCVQMQAWDLSAGMWNDVGCDGKKGFICQADPDPSLPESEPESDCFVCPDGSVKYRESCYSLSEESKTWNEAEDICQSQGGHLVSMVDNFEWSLVKTIANKNEASDSYWIGLQAKLTHQNLIEEKPRHLLQWSDNRPVNQLKWAHDEPKYSNSKTTQCIEMDAQGQWSVSDCNDKKQFYCIKHATEVEKKAKMEGLCPFADGIIDVGAEYCYVVVKDQSANWDGARLRCGEQGGDLAFFKEQSELDLLRPYLHSKGNYNKWYYVAIKDKGYKDYKSVDGETFNSSMWEEGEPNNLDSEKCVTVLSQSMRYYNSPCDRYQYNYICQIPRIHIVLNATSSALTTADEVEGNCKKGWEKFRNKCYKIFSNSREDVLDMDFEDAQKFCKDQNPESGSVAMIKSWDDQDFFTAYLGRPGVKSSVYIGLHRDRENEDFKWIDGEKLEWDNFVPGEPSNGDFERCVQMQDFELSAGYWNDVTCFGKKGFICQANPDPSLPEPEPEVDCNPCPEGSVKYRESCYSFSLDEKTWDEAEDECKSQGGHLVSIIDNFEWAFVNTIVADHKANFWIGLRAKVSHRKLFEHKGRHQLEWSDNRPVNHIDWDDNEPNYSRSEKKQCVERKENEMWAISNCNEKKAFICNKHANETQMKPKSEGFCPVTQDIGHALIDVGSDYCYLVTKTSFTWPLARMKCQNLGGDLAFFKHQSELDLLRPYLQTNNSFNKMYFVAITTEGYNDYKSVDGQSFDSNMWHEEEPNNLNSEKCVMVYAQSMRYVNTRCFSYQEYICQIPKVDRLDSAYEGSGDYYTADNSEEPQTEPDTDEYEYIEDVLTIDTYQDDEIESDIDIKDKLKDSEDNNEVALTSGSDNNENSLETILENTVYTISNDVGEEKIQDVVEVLNLLV